MKYYLAIFTTIFFFSTVEVASKLLNGAIQPVFLSLLRFSISGLLIMMIDYKKAMLLTKKDALFMTLIGILGVTTSLGFFHVSLNYIEASKGAVIFSLNPIFSTFAAYLFYKERLNAASIIGIIGGFVGVYILSFGYSMIEFKNITGPLMMLISSSTFGFYIVLAKKYVKKYGAFFTTGFVFLSGSIFYLPLIRDYTFVYSVKNIMVLTYIILFCTGIAYLCYFYGLKHLPVSVGTSIFYLKPVMASIFAVLVLNERLTPNYYIGLVIVLFSLAVITIFKPKISEKIIAKGTTK